MVKKDPQNFANQGIYAVVVIILIFVSLIALIEQLKEKPLATPKFRRGKQLAEEITKAPEFLLLLKDEKGRIFVLHKNLIFWGNINKLYPLQRLESPDYADVKFLDKRIAEGYGLLGKNDLITCGNIGEVQLKNFNEKEKIEFIKRLLGKRITIMDVPQNIRTPCDIVFQKTRLERFKTWINNFLVYNR